MMTRWIAILTCVLALGGTARAQTTVTLRSAVEWTAGKAITVGTVALTAGPQAQAVDAVVVLGAADAKARAGANGWVTIDVDAVRTALERTAGVSVGRIALRGSSCSVKIDGEGPKVTPKSVAPARPAPSVVAADATAAGTIAERIGAHLASMFHIERADLRIKYASPDTAEGMFMARMVAAGERVELQVTTTGGRVPVRVEIYHKDRLVETKTVGIEATIQRDVLTSIGLIDRDTTITDSMVSTEKRWVSPGDATPIDRGQAIGAVAKRRIEAGRMVTEADIQPPIVVQRGEEIWVHCLSGGVVVKIKARAQAPGRDGQMVELKREGAKKTFLARMSGRGVAVMDMGTTTAEPSAMESGTKERTRNRGGSK